MAICATGPPQASRPNLRKRQNKPGYDSRGMAGDGRLSIINRLPLLQPVERLACAERVQRSGGHEAAHALLVHARVLPQRPADGLVDEEFLRTEILADQLLQQVEVGLILVA